MSTIITPTHAIFKEGEVYVFQLPERPNVSLTCDEQCDGECGYICPVIEANRRILQKYGEAVSYARAHPIKVDSKDKEEITNIIVVTEALIRRLPYEQFIDWQPQDLTEYKIEGVRMEIKEVRDQSKCTWCKIDCRANLGKGKCGAPFKQVACLIEDDKAESHSSKVLDSLLGEITPEEQDTTDKMMIDKAKSHDLWMEVCEIISSHTGVESVSEILNKGFKIVRR